jgi:hypothetical protein
MQAERDRVNLAEFILASMAKGKRAITELPETSVSVGQPPLKKRKRKNTKKGDARKGIPTDAPSVTSKTKKTVVTTKTTTAAKEVPTYGGSSDNTTSGATSIAPDTTPDAEEVPTDAGINDWGEWNPDEWYWNEEYETWVYVEPKRIRPRDLTNKMEKNWLLGMRRNWNTAKKR